MLQQVTSPQPYAHYVQQTIPLPSSASDVQPITASAAKHNRCHPPQQPVTGAAPRVQAAAACCVFRISRQLSGFVIRQPACCFIPAAVIAPGSCTTLFCSPAQHAQHALGAMTRVRKPPTTYHSAPGGLLHPFVGTMCRPAPEQVQRRIRKPPQNAHNSSCQRQLLTWQLCHGQQ